MGVWLLNLFRSKNRGVDGHERGFRGGGGSSAAPEESGSQPKLLAMRTSTAVIGLGVLLFVLPLP